MIGSSTFSGNRELTSAAGTCRQVQMQNGEQSSSGSDSGREFSKVCSATKPFAVVSAAGPKVSSHGCESNARICAARMNTAILIDSRLVSLSMNCQFNFLLHVCVK